MKRRKIVSLLLSAALLCSLMTACGKSEKSGGGKTKEGEKPAVTTAAPAEEKETEKETEPAETTKALQIPDEVKEGPIYDFAMALVDFKAVKVLEAADSPSGLKPEPKSFEKQLGELQLYQGYTDKNLYTFRVAAHPTTAEIYIIDKKTNEPVRTFEFALRNGKPALESMEESMTITSPYVQLGFTVNGKKLDLKAADGAETDVRYTIKDLLPGTYKVKFDPNIYGYGEYEVDRDSGFSHYNVKGDINQAYLTDAKFKELGETLTEFMKAFIPSVAQDKRGDAGKGVKNDLKPEVLDKLHKAYRDKLTEDADYYGWKKDKPNKIEFTGIGDISWADSETFNVVTGNISPSFKVNGEEANGPLTLKFEVKADKDLHFVITKIDTD